MRVVVLVLSSILVIVFDGGPAPVLSDSPSKRVQVLNGSPYVHLQHGLYFGKTLQTYTNRKYHAFLGIRYAVTPRRYEKSVPMTDLDMLSSPLLAQTLGSPCPQITRNGTLLLGKEDCLLANVFIPDKEPVDKDGFPVLVFIHPGSFKSGNGGAFDVSYFMSMENAPICVTFNFRLGSLGFLDADGVSNLGLRDQVTLLEWLNSNIASFGGNKRRICLAGIEAGATSVKYLLLSKVFTKGLFQSAIIHGGMLSTFFPRQDYYTRQFSDELECPHRPSHLLVECLKTKRLKDVIRSQKIISEKYFDFSSPFLPAHETCDRFKVCSNSFFSKPPGLLLSERQYKRVSLLIGMNSADTLVGSWSSSSHNLIEKTVPPLLQPEPGTAEQQQETFTRWLVQVLQQIPGFQHEDFGKSFFMEIQQLYFRESMRNGSSSSGPASSGGSFNSETLDKSLSNFLYDIFVVYGLWKFAMTYAHDKPVYPYLITFPETGNNSISDHYRRAFPDGVEFLTPSLPEYHEFETGSDQEIFSRQLVHLWTTFATHQKPVDVWQNKDTWLPLSVAQLNGEKPVTWYALNKEVDIIPEPFAQRMKFWDRVLRQKDTR